MNKIKRSNKRIKRTLARRFILYEEDFEIIQPKTMAKTVKNRAIRAKDTNTAKPPSSELQ